MLDKAILKTEATNETDATDDRAEVERVERIEAERQLQEVLEIQEKERSRYILERMDWDKNFNDVGDGAFEDIQSSNKPAVMSELQEKQEEKIQLVRCGRILWRSIIFGLYMFLVGIVVQSQLYSYRSFKINSTIDEYLVNLKRVVTDTQIYNIRYSNGYSGLLGYPNRRQEWKESMTDEELLKQHKETESKILESVTIDSIKNLNDTVTFLKYVLPEVGKSQKLKTAFDIRDIDIDFPEDKSEFSGFFINDRSYLVGDFLRLSFKFNPVNDDFKKESDRVLKNNSDILEYDDDGKLHLRNEASEKLWK